MRHVTERSTPWIDSGDVPDLPLDRHPSEILTQGVADPVFDIDCFPLTIVNSRIFAFIYQAEERDLRHILPEPLSLEDDLVEFWYAHHPNTSMGPYTELGITVAVSLRACDGRTLHAGYYPYMFVTQQLPFSVGHEPYGFGKKTAYVSILEHGGREDDGYGPPGNDYFSFITERRGYLIHTATGRYDDGDLARRPVFYGDARYGRLNLRMLTDATFRTTSWELLYLPAALDTTFAAQLGRPELGGKPRFQIKPESVRTASPAAIRSWAYQATPYDNMGAFLPCRALIGLMSFSFDLALPPAETVWSKLVERRDEDMAALFGATAFQYTMRQRFPKPQVA